MPLLSFISAIAALFLGVAIGRYGCPKIPTVQGPPNLDEHEVGIAPLPIEHKSDGYATIVGGDNFKTLAPKKASEVPFSGARTMAGPVSKGVKKAVKKYGNKKYKK